MLNTIRELRLSLAEAILIRKASLHRNCQCGPIHICEARELIKRDAYLLVWQQTHDKALEEEATLTKRNDDEEPCTRIR